MAEYKKNEIDNIFNRNESSFKTFTEDNNIEKHVYNYIESYDVKNVMAESIGQMINTIKSNHPQIDKNEIGNKIKSLLSIEELINIALK